jgi:DNA-directed RNA polymerase III subunit RPC9
MKEENRLKDQKNLATVTYEAIKYLEELKCIHQKDDQIHNFLTIIKEKQLRLTKAEKLQIINTRPNNLIELQLLIEENEERFSEDALNLILDIVKTTLPINDSHNDANQDMSDESNDDEEDNDDDDFDEEDEDEQMNQENNNESKGR